MVSQKSFQGLFRSRTAVGCGVIILAMLLGIGIPGLSSGQPKTVAEIALYQGPDREKILMEGAKKEGKLTFYNSHTWFRTVADEFEKKYPFIKVSEWRSSSQELYKRVYEEFAASRFLVDVIETTDLMAFLQRDGILQEYYSPETRFYKDEHKKIGKAGVYYLADREIYIGLGFNTKLIPPPEAPKTLNDLLDPRWKGKMSITGTKTGTTWLGNALETMGPDFIEKLSRQDVKIQNVSGAALIGLVVSGEVPLSPSIFNDNTYVARKKGAPVEWRPLEPVVTNIGFSGLTTKAPHPYAAVLFLDYLHSKEGQKVEMQGGPNSPREDMGSPETKFKKTIFEDKYSPEEFEKKLNEWEGLIKRLFIKR